MGISKTVKVMKVVKWEKSCSLKGLILCPRDRLHLLQDILEENSKTGDLDFIYRGIKKQVALSHIL